jgi:Sec-independent protein translocase protein TatA
VLVLLEELSMFGITDTVLIIVVLAVILLFGAPKVIEWAKSLGEAKKAFADASEGKAVKTKAKKK